MYQSEASENYHYFQNWHILIDSYVDCNLYSDNIKTEIIKKEIIEEESVDLNTVKTENIVTLVKEEVNYDYIVEQKIKIDNFD